MINGIDKKIMESTLHKFSVAPMLDWTDRHCRYFHRLLTKRSLLYSEMVTTGAVLYGKGDHLAFSEEEHPICFQLAGADPAALADCALLVEQHGYDAINFNVGCPSHRVQRGRFGASLMVTPDRVADCIAAMQSKVTIPVTVKMRIGVDERTDYDFLCCFVETVMHHSQVFIVHARSAWLSGLSAKGNRSIPPLDYGRVYQLKKDYPQLTIVLNGGIKILQEAEKHLQYVDGVMIGREAYHNPWLLATVDQRLFNDRSPVVDKKEVILKLLPYIERALVQGARLNQITRHILGLFNGHPGAKQWRRHLSQYAGKSGADVGVIEKAMSFID